MPPTRFGMEVTRDPRLVFQLRNGRRIRPPMQRKILAYLDRAEGDPAFQIGRRRR